MEEKYVTKKEFNLLAFFVLGLCFFSICTVLYLLFFT